VTEHDGLNQFRLGDLLSTTLNHGDTVSATGHDDVDIAFFKDIHVRVDGQLTIEPTDPYASHRVGGRHIRYCQGRTGPDQSQDIGVVALIVRDDKVDTLCLTTKILWKQRPDGSIDQTR